MFYFQLHLRLLLFFILCARITEAQIIPNPTVIFPNNIGGNGTHIIEFHQNFDYRFNEDDLRFRPPFGFGADGFLFPVEIGDELNQETLPNFDLIVDGGNDFTLSKIPFGDSYMGFAFSGQFNFENPEETPWQRVGWAKFHRPDVGLEVLQSAVVRSGTTTVTVGVVPEPRDSCAILLAAFAVVVGITRRRRLDRH